MCRLALMNNEYINNIGEGYMKTFLDHLEVECGGHGNGYAFIKDGKVIDIDKALNLSNQEIINRLYKIQPEWFMYHTRVASVGVRNDSNCHPYWNEDKSFVLCMNGTEGEIGSLADGLGITDTNLIFKNLDKFNIKEDVLADLSSKFLGFRNGKVFATNPIGGYGGLKFDDTKGICIASSFPRGYNGGKSMKDCYIWREGEKLEEFTYKVSKYGKSFYDYNDYSDSWDYYSTPKTYSCSVNKSKDKTVTESENKIYDIVDECNDAILRQDMDLGDVREILIDKYGEELEVTTPMGTRYFKFGTDFVFVVDNTGQYVY